MKRMKGKIITILVMAAISLLFLFVVSFNEDKGEGRAQYLEHIDYQVNMKKDGSMQVIETWDIDVANTNTLVRNFKLSKVKFGNITNVQVIDLQNEKSFTDIGEEMYHVPKDKFYALELNSSEFEIAFGVGMDEETGNRKFQISYNVENVVTTYKDCQEIYWQFLAKGQNAIPAKKVTGKLTLPYEVSNIDNLLIWGHGQLNGKIEKLSKSEVGFEMDDLSAGAMFEIRVVTEDEMFEVGENKNREYRYLQQILTEEEKWAEEANTQTNGTRIFFGILFTIYAIILIIRIIQIRKLANINKQKNDKIEKSEIKYYRDIPREKTATPAEATYLYKFEKTRLDTGKVQSNAVSATILDLCYKKKIQLRIDENETVYMKVISDETVLNKDELEIYKLLKDVNKNGEEFEIKELKQYANKKYTEYADSINKFVNNARNSLYNLKLIDKANEKLYAKFSNAKLKMSALGYGYLWGLITYLLGQIPILKIRLDCYYEGFFSNGLLWLLIVLLPITLVCVTYWKLQDRSKNKIAVLTQEGSDEKAKWKGLANYMKEYSLLNEKDVLSLVIWEKYLIYATAFGIADKVIEQMKAKYPEVFIKENWDEQNMKEKYPVIYFALNPIYHTSSTTYYHSISNLGNGITGAYRNSMAQIAAHSSSSGGGRRRRLLRRRRRPEVAGGRNGRKIVIDDKIRNNITC